MANTSALQTGIAHFANLAYKVGAMSAPRDQMFFAPDVRGAKIIGWASLAFLGANLVLGVYGQITRFVLWALCAAALFFVIKNFRDKERLKAAAVILVLAAVVPLIVGLFRILSALGLPILASIIGLYGFIYSGGKAFDAALQALRHQLGDGWTAYTPKIAGAEPVSRVILGPNAQAFLVGFAPGRLEQHYNESILKYDFDPEQLLYFLQAEVRADLKPVLWVGKPAGDQRDYSVATHGKVNIVYDAAPQFAHHLSNWDLMLNNLKVTDQSNRDEVVRQQAIDSLEKALPDGWRMQRELSLAEGGRADLLILSPLGRQYVIRISPGQTPPQMDAAGEQLHHDLMIASRQLFAEPVVWQPTLRGAQGLLWEMRFLQGSAGELLMALDTAHDEARKGETGERKQLVVTDETIAFLPRTGSTVGLSTLEELPDGMTIDSKA